MYVENILENAKKALKEMQYLNLYNAKLSIISVIEALEHPALRYICVDTDKFEQARQERENEIRHGVEEKV